LAARSFKDGGAIRRFFLHNHQAERTRSRQLWEGEFIFMRTAVLALCFWMALTGTVLADCSSKPYCKDVSSCAEAYYHLTQCGLTRLDRDRDGIPCEKTCGKTHATMQARIEVRPFNSVGSDVAAATSLLGPATAIRAQCGSKRYCGEMLTCEEARYYLNTCGISSLDGNSDGIPCNGLCPRP